MRVSGLGKCVNPGCSTEFKRLGTGKIYTLPVKLPQAWGLPPHVKQKVVWLCGKCSMNKRVEFDMQRCQVLVVSREQAHQRSA
ncbi:MAG TPA: hypothetical protein VK976_07800 [Verrucomicrobiae bacterium]|jgi:hypothetical protein|nr:hypothetical protein [Verrucomicrobiae bacterium]